MVWSPVAMVALIGGAHKATRLRPRPAGGTPEGRRTLEGSASAAAEQAEALGDLSPQISRLAQSAPP